MMQYCNTDRTAALASVRYSFNIYDESSSFMPSSLINSSNQQYWWLVQSQVCEPQCGLNGTAGILTDGSMWGYNDEDGSALRKVVMRKRMRVEEFVFSEAAGCSRCSSGCHRMVLKPRAVGQFPCAIQHLWKGAGWGGHWKALLSKTVRDSSVVRLQSHRLDFKQVFRSGSWKLWMLRYAMMRHRPWCVRLNVWRRWVTPLTGLLSAVTGWQWKVCIPPSACVPHNLLISFYNGGGPYANNWCG